MSLEQISNKSISETPFFEIGRHTLPGFTPLLLNAEALNVGSTVETIWPEGGLYKTPTVATIMTLSGLSANDTLLGTGIRRVLIVGLDVNYKWIYETVSLNGLTPVNTVNEYLRINMMQAVECGSLETNDDTIYLGTGIVTAGKPAIVYSLIPNGTLSHINKSMQGIITVPKGYTCYITSCFAGVGAGKDFKIGVNTRLKEECWVRCGTLPLYENSVNIPFSIMPNFPEKTDIMILGRETGATGVNVSGTLSLLLERVDFTEKFIIPNSLITSDTWSFK